MEDGSTRALPRWPAVLAVLCIGAAGANAQMTGGEAPVPDGDYVAISIRTATTVAAPMPDGPIREDSYLGHAVSFGDTIEWFEGATCEDFRTEVMDFMPLDIDDPILSDLQVPAIDGPVSAGDRRLNVPIMVFCDGERMIDFVMVDRRVLVMGSANGAVHVVLEKPLQSGQIERFQEQLKDMKFYHGEITGVLDAATRRGASFYASYRGAAYPFETPGITENLLDGLRVLRDE